MTVTSDDPRPPSVQIADTLRAEIESGELRAGQRLQSIRELSERFGVASATVQAALRVLRDEALVFSAGNRGTFVGERSAPDGTDVGTNPTLLARLGELEARVSALENAGHGNHDA